MLIGRGLWFLHGVSVMCLVMWCCRGACVHGSVTSIHQPLRLNNIPRLVPHEGQRCTKYDTKAAPGSFYANEVISLKNDNRPP